MRENVKEKKNTKEQLFSGKEIDISIIFIAVFLSVFCLVFVYSALAFEEGASKTIFNILTLKSSDRTLLKTLIYIIAGIVGMLVLALANVKGFNHQPQASGKAPLYWCQHLWYTHEYPGSWLSLLLSSARCHHDYYYHQSAG